MTVFPGPGALGRGAVVRVGQPAPEPLTDAARLRVDEQVVSDPEAASATAAHLRERWHARRPTVIELAVEPEVLKEPETERRPVWQLGSGYTFPREQLRLLVWTNAYDCRTGQPVWWHGRLACWAGAQPSEHADVEIAGVGPVWVDGGPRGPVPGLDTPTVHAQSVADRRLTVARDAPVADELAPDQLAAVAHRAGAARVLAPAGSGKTRVLAGRLRHLVHGRGVDPDHITAVAYNNRAAADLRRRVGQAGARVATLHALGFEIVRAARPGVRLVDEAEARRVLERLAPVRPKPNTDVLAPYLEGFEQVRVGLIAPDAVAAQRPDAPQFPRVYEAWRAWLADHDAIDFDEQIHHAVELLMTDADLRAAFQRSARLLLVDEFQDLSPAFLLLVRLLAAPAGDVYGVGDDDQTIYSYRNADPAHLVHFDRWFPHAATYVLEVNYRCPADVVEAATALLARNRVRVRKPIRARPDAPTNGLRIRRVDGDALATDAVSWVRERLDDGVQPRDVAVLARVHALLLPVQVGLMVAGVPVVSRVGVELLERTGARAALAWLRLAAGDPHRIDGPDAAEAVRRSPRKIRADTLRALAGQATWSPGAIRRLAFDRLQVWEGKELRGWLDDVAGARRAALKGTVAALTEIRALLSDDLSVLDEATTASKQASSHLDDLTALIQVAPLQPDVAAFEPWLRNLLATKPADDTGHGRVQLNTVHATKGLEWDRVLVFGVNDGLLPHRLAAGTRARREEERRVFHVALTRGRREVVVLASRTSPSPFLAELSPARPARARHDRAAERRRPYQASSADGPVAQVGSTVQAPGGVTGTVEIVDGDGLHLRLRSGSLPRVRYGERVEIDGVRGLLRRSGVGGG